MTAKKLTTAFKKDLYYRMVVGRTFEDQVYYMFLKGTLPGTVHQSQGQEATAVGVCAALRDDDMVIGGHRPHNLALAKGVTPRAAMAELYGCKSGCFGGKGGSMHLGSMDVGMIPALAIVGASITLAPGFGLAFKMQKSDRVAAAVFGDGASNEGAFHEGINFAAVKQLPVLFICENNLYGASTPYNEVSRVPDIAKRACAYGIPGEIVDGMDVLAVYETVSSAVERARSGKGPTLIECKTYRFAGHSRSDAKKYRPDGEEEEWKKRDPINVLGEKLVADGEATQEELDQLTAKAEAVVQDAIEYSENEPKATAADAFTGLYRAM